jgi:hypothetical protein
MEGGAQPGEGLGAGGKEGAVEGGRALAPRGGEAEEGLVVEGGLGETREEGMKGVGLYGVVWAWKPSPEQRFAMLMERAERVVGRA